MFETSLHIPYLNQLIKTNRFVFPEQTKPLFRMPKRIVFFTRTQVRGMNHDLVPNSLATGPRCVYFFSVNARMRPHCTRSIDIDF